MNKTIQINDADVIMEEDRNFFPPHSLDGDENLDDEQNLIAELHLIVKRTPELEVVDEGDTLKYKGRKYRMHSKDIGSDPDSPIQFGLFVIP
jgi:hypothetical protein